MSWSLNLTGKPDNVKAALQAESERLTGQSKTEFDEALPHLVGLIDMNSNCNPESPPVLVLQANGHASFKDGQKVYSGCHVQLSNCNTKLV